MIFTTNRRFAKQPTPDTNTNTNGLAVAENAFSSRYRNFISPRPSSSTSVAEPTVTDPNKKSMKWGAPTWFLFHTLAEKVKPEYFPEIRKELLNIIYTICTNLPCPYCAKHATQYLNNINFNTIDTKDALKFMLHRFHNEVNRRKNVPEFPIDQLSAKYSVANTINIIHYFMPYFEDKHRNMKLIADDLHRSQVAMQLKAWFNKKKSALNKNISLNI
jgi:hypothetical protein